MSDEPEKPVPSASGDIYMHAPMPYVVVLRATLSEDATAERFEKRVMAYSLLEAAMQAIMESTGVAPDAGLKYTIESIGPDIPAWTKKLLDETLKAALVGKRR